MSVSVGQHAGEIVCSGHTPSQHLLNTASVGLHSCTHTRCRVASLVTTLVSTAGSGPVFNKKNLNEL